MNDMEIKQGDKVRVSRDVPLFYLKYNSYRMFEIEHKVVDMNMEDGFALLDSIPPKFTTILPTKYLIMVGEENKPKFQEGERVLYKGVPYTVESVSNINGWKYIIARISDGIVAGAAERFLEPFTQPTEQTEAEKKPNVGSIKIPVKVDFKEVAKEYAEAMSNAIREYGDALCKHGTFIRMVDDLYKRDLAKEVALKVANKYNDPEQAAKYAVSVAKAVVEGLKRK